MNRRATPAVLVAVAAVVVAALLLGVRSESPPAPTLSPAAIASPTSTPASTASPSASPLPAGTFENLVLGYRITMPTGYRRSTSRIFTGGDLLGDDFYGLTTEAQARDACLQDTGDLPPRLEGDPPLFVQVYRNSRGLSAAAWAAASPLSTHEKLERTTVGGLEAVRFVSDNAAATTDGYVILANDRIYQMYPPQGPPPKTWLDGIARTFVAIQPAAFPSPTATTAPHVAAAELAEKLRAAFAAKDADAVARLMPDCTIASHR